MSRKFWRSLVTAVAAMLLVTLAGQNLSAADTIDERLAAAVYQEETAGNLGEAIKLYREIVRDGKDAATVAAKAHLRLARCLKKLGKQSDARHELEQLIAGYPDVTDVVRQAKAELESSMPLLAAPWKSGERQTLVMKFAGGQTIGLIGLNANLVQHEGRDAWRFGVHRYVLVGDNEGFSDVLVDADNNHPIRTVWQHLILGNGTATYHDNEVVFDLTQPSAETKTVPLSGVTYSNDQVFFLLRQLPLSVGAEITLPICTEFAHMAMDIKLTVPKIESITTPAGTFECFRVEMNIGQTFWVANDEQRSIVKFDAGAVIGELISTGDGQAEQRDIGDGFSLTLPAGWHLATFADAKLPRALIIAPAMCNVMVRVEERKEAGKLNAEQAQADRVNRLKKTLKSLVVRDNVDKKTELAGSDAVRIVYDHSFAKANYVGDEVLARTKEFDLLIAAQSEKSIYSEIVTELDALRASLTHKE
ncbi:MAG: DUF3108 domain-containing protein [Planctomycetales bacterium]|nr:DUF3108 domain-containing protein [Planctomycetales bacterium]MCA9170442.1 DUF3108 domain-containing protein [Planctomycetales bacterium]